MKEARYAIYIANCPVSAQQEGYTPKYIFFTVPKDR